MNSIKDSMNNHLLSYLALGLTPIPLKPSSKEPLVKWSQWNPTCPELKTWFTQPKVNIGIRCGKDLAVLDFDSSDSFHNFLSSHKLFAQCPLVKTGRGYHLWFKPKRPIPSQKVPQLGGELKCLGSYVVAPPSIHPTGIPYTFKVALNGALPVIDLDQLLDLVQIDTQPRQYESIHKVAPSDFALHYGKSSFSRFLCGLATKVFTRADDLLKHCLSLRDWKWDCPKCAPLLKRYWLEKLGSISFRFMLKMPNMSKPTTFLRRIGKPDYAHIVDNGESWLFLTGGENEQVWAEASRARYKVVVGDIAGDPTHPEINKCLEEALAQEEKPLNTRRKVTHSRSLLKKGNQDNNAHESKRNLDCEKKENESVRNEKEVAVMGKEPHKWKSEVVMKPIKQVMEDLESEGWKVVWKSEVEAFAFNPAKLGEKTNIVDLIKSLGIKLKKVGSEYEGLCPFHDDHQPSLRVNREKQLWHCFGCEKGGNAHQFIEEWQSQAPERGA